MQRGPLVISALSLAFCTFSAVFPSFSCSSDSRMTVTGTSPAVQWSRLRASTAGGAGSIPGQGTKIPNAAQRGQKKRMTMTLFSSTVGSPAPVKCSSHKLALPPPPFSLGLQPLSGRAYNTPTHTQCEWRSPVTSRKFCPASSCPECLQGFQNAVRLKACGFSHPVIWCFISETCGKACR